MGSGPVFWCQGWALVSASRKWRASGKANCNAHAAAVARPARARCRTAVAGHTTRTTGRRTRSHSPARRTRRAGSRHRRAPPARNEGTCRDQLLARAWLTPSSRPTSRSVRPDERASSTASWRGSGVLRWTGHLDILPRPRLVSGCPVQGGTSILGDFAFVLGYGCGVPCRVGCVRLRVRRRLLVFCPAISLTLLQGRRGLA
jgi:hypothetical protein